MTDKSGADVKPENDLRTTLQGAALALFRERGYDRTTAAAIAARAGVTERTFFRHFPDKREVLFDGEALVRAALTTSIADAPPGLDPLAVVIRAFREFRPMLEDKWDYAKPRHDVIAATPPLAERELTKVAALADAVAAALELRGVPTLRAVLAARTGMTAFVHAASAWLDDPEVGLAERMDLAFGELGTLLAGGD